MPSTFIDGFERYYYTADVNANSGTELVVRSVFTGVGRSNISIRELMDYQAEIVRINEYWRNGCRRREPNPIEEEIEEEIKDIPPIDVVELSGEIELVNGKLERKWI